MIFPGSPSEARTPKASRKLVKDGRVTTAQIDSAVRRILEVKSGSDSLKTLTLTSRQWRQFTTTRSTGASRALPRSARQCCYATRTTPPTQQRDPKISSIAVVGPLADSKRDMRGAWSLADDVKSAVTVLEGIRAKVGPGLKVEFAQGVDIGRVYPSPS